MVVETVNGSTLLWRSPVTWSISVEHLRMRSPSVTSTLDAYFHQITSTTGGTQQRRWRLGATVLLNAHHLIERGAAAFDRGVTDFWQEPAPPRP